MEDAKKKGCLGDNTTKITPKLCTGENKMNLFILHTIVPICSAEPCVEIT
jgi:hypothetical protein